MLVLHRRKEQIIRIGDDVRIVVLRTERGGVSLGIDAPKDVPIMREEIYTAPEMREEVA